MTNSGSARDRRRLRRGIEKRQGVWDIILKYIGLIIGLTGFGYTLMDVNIYIASVLYLVAVIIFLRGLQFLRGARWKTVARLILRSAVLLVFVYFDYQWIRDDLTPTFLYVVPTRELIDCERRAFFVNHSGLKDLQNIEISIKDNRSGIVQSANYPEIDPGPQNPDAVRYLWVKPSHPWDEDYTITAAGKKYHSVQQMVLRSAKQKMQFAVQIIADQKKKPVLSCRDNLIPDSYALARGSGGDCNNVMSADPKMLARVQPEFYVLQQPDGSLLHVRDRQLPLASDLDSQSEDRHLTEFQKTIMRSKLAKYRGSKLLILHVGGPRTLAYAIEFRDFFRSLGWGVSGPRSVPAGDERLVDIQVSVSNRYWNTPYPRARELLSSLEGIKHRQTHVYDDAIPPDLILLWVGPKSPNNFKPDDCAPARLRPRPGEHNTCEMVALTRVACTWPPQ
jgi:hypothetical protein